MSTTTANLPEVLTPDQLAKFRRDGILVLRSFYDYEKDIVPIQLAVHNLIGLLIRHHNLPIQQPDFSPATFDAGLREIVAIDRQIAADLYDAVKQIPAFVRMAVCERNEAIFAQLRQTPYVGFAARSYGIRIDHPGEAKYSADWHQEYLSHLRSLDGVVFWSSLVPVDEATGPVRFCPGSQNLGLLPVSMTDPTLSRTMTIIDRDDYVSKYDVIAPTTQPGDLVLIDFLTLHASSPNVGDHSRWSMQFRYFNFAEPTGLKNAWPGSFQAGVDIREIHPEAVIDLSQQIAA
jgi:hypothetical protein